jgi:hypothetical protein
MKKLLVQLGLVFSCAILFSGCSNEGSLPAEAEEDAFFDPLPQGLPVFTEIGEAFIADSLEGDGRTALFSYQLPENDADSSEIKEIFSADKRQMISLNTVNESEPDRIGRSEVTLLVRNDSVYLINLQNDQIRLLSHFTNTVCELIPRETVDVEEIKDANTGKITKKILTVLHDDLVYVMTAEGTGANACQSEGKKRFYALPLDHQLDPSQDENGELNLLELVNESLARAKLMFAWVDDPQMAGKHMLTYGFLGYGLEEIDSPTLKPALVLYDNNRQQVWRQDRSLEKFPIVQVTPETTNPAYLFDIQALANQHYVIQLGLDMFVVDSGEALFSKTFNQTKDILSDRSLKLSPTSNEDASASYAAQAQAFFDEDDLLIVDGGKIFYSEYQASTPSYNPTLTYEIVSQNPTNIADRSFAEKRYFSQFDLKACQDDAACQAAHDVESLQWQFITPCDESLGCTLNNQVDNFCETIEEKEQTQSDETLCTASDYRHLSELNTPANDMLFKGFMQYSGAYIRDLEFALEADRLFITARMNEKELLLRYNYSLDFSAAKSLREQVLLGNQTKLFGLDAHFVANNLFLTALTEGSIRSNECYKKYKRVLCDLGELIEDGNDSVCTGKDLSDGLCTNKYQEYESRALFCTQTQLTDGDCSDVNLGQIEVLFDETAEEDAKWLRLYDYSANGESYEMRLLVGDHTQALNEGKLDEGRLLDPRIFTVDHVSGEPLEAQGVVTGSVEQAVNGWIVKEAVANTVEVLAHLRLISEDIVSGDTSGIKSKLVHYLIEQSYADADSEPPYIFKVEELGVSQFDRP